MTTQVCEHLRALEDDPVAKKRAVPIAGQAGSANCRHWVYFDAVLGLHPEDAAGQAAIS